MRLKNPAHVKFINAFTRSGDIEIAIKESGVSEKRGKEILARYKSIYEGFFERLGMSKESVIQEHIKLIKEPVKSETITAQGETKTTFDNNVKLRAIEAYYKLIKAIDEPAININTNISINDAITEQKVADEIVKSPELQKLFMEHIEKLKATGGK